MRIIYIGFALLFVAACGAPEAPPPEEVPHAEAPAAPPAQPLETGALGAISNTAMGITGALTVAPDALRFERGFTANTEYVGVVDATAATHAGGQSFAEAAPGPTSLRVELRRIIPQAPQQICGSVTPATYIALAHDEPLTGLSLIVFSGAEAPGPEAADSAICATFSYAVD